MAMRNSASAPERELAPAFQRLIGTTVGTKYLIERFIGAGGMGAVFAGRDTDLDRNVAVKVILPEFTVNPTAGARLLKEARLTAKLKHPGIVTIHTVEMDDDGRFFIVEELLEGHDLAHAMIHDSFPTAFRLFERMYAILDALAAAHRAGIVHRDLKPENIMVTRSGGGEHIVLIDFGVGRDQNAVSRVTLKGEVVGSAEYMSPEQAHNLPDVGASTDVWAIGTLFYWMLVGETPWAATTYPEQILAIATREMPDIRVESRWRIPDDLAAVINRAVHRDRSQRYASAVEMQAAFKAVDCEAFVEQFAFGYRSMRPKELAREAMHKAEREKLRPPCVRLSTPGEREVDKAFWRKYSAEKKLPGDLVIAVTAAIDAGTRFRYVDVNEDLTERAWVDIKAEEPLEQSHQALLDAGFAHFGAMWWWFGEYQPPYSPTRKALPAMFAG